MKIKDGYTLDYSEEQIAVIPPEGETPPFSGTLILTDTAAFAWEVLTRDVSRDRLVEIITDNFDDVSREQVSADVDALIEAFRQLGLLEE